MERNCCWPHWVRLLIAIKVLVSADGQSVDDEGDEGQEDDVEVVAKDVTAAVMGEFKDCLTWLSSWLIFIRML